MRPFILVVLDIVYVKKNIHTLSFTRTDNLLRSDSLNLCPQEANLSHMNCKSSEVVSVSAARGINVNTAMDREIS